jgi:hypothetical protein
VVVEYYRSVVRHNLDRKKKLVADGEGTEAGLNRLLDGDDFAIQMTGLPKGLRGETSVNVLIEAPRETNELVATLDPRL